MDQPVLRFRTVIALAVPVMLAQAATAATGVVDTAIMGLSGTKVDLAAVAIASMSFSFLYWAFGFLRMSTTGLTAQAMGEGHPREAALHLQRGLILGLFIALCMVALGPVLRPVIFLPFGAEAAVNDEAEAYFAGRIWGAPALLMGYAITGWLIGTGRTGALLAMQIVMNGLNAGLDMWFVLGLGWGPAGIGAGTALAEWGALIFGLWLVRGTLNRQGKIRDTAALKALFGANRDILIRTLALLFCFAWFVRSGAHLGIATLAGNEVLLQFITVSAFVLDGFAFVAEKQCGEAYGARDRAQMRRAFMVTNVLALAFGAVISALYALTGPSIISAFVKDEAARDVALSYLPWCALGPLMGVAAWQLDGLFLGATQGKALRIAGVFSAVAYLATDLLLRPLFGNSGVWAALLALYIYRAIALSFFVP
ncbi:MAG: MATE family efflux transporter, partial [Pseudomonadota bacterium]